MKDNKRFWDTASLIYTRSQEKGNNNLYKALNEFAMQYVNNTKEVLEIGCGTGQMTKELAPISKSYMATDFSEKMIKRGKKRNIANAEFKVMNALKIDYPDNSFDVVVAANVLHVMPDCDTALSEIYRVLKSDGLIIAPSFVREGFPNKFKLFMLEMLGFKTYHKWSSKEYQKVITAHGFNIIDVKPINASPTMNLFIVGKKK